MTATSPQFEIIKESEHGLLRIVMRGHWDVAMVSQYKAALVEAVNAMIAAGCESGSLVALVDAREQGAQSQDVIADYKERLGGGDLAPRRLATLVSSALFKRQVERIAIGNQRLFTDEAEAIAWLLSGTP
ncbi:hypothetical protein U1839_00535 [Sphingomonas sp. RT2P30]|uniref:hypothetical protein n=1 Tax=Parasphingomonas halimpatiens TaxID=3096162 RepID=UPI002FCA17AF